MPPSPPSPPRLLLLPETSPLPSPAGLQAEEAQDRIQAPGPRGGDGVPISSGPSGHHLRAEDEQSEQLLGGGTSSCEQKIGSAETRAVRVCVCGGGAEGDGRRGGERKGAGGRQAERPSHGSLRLSHCCGCTDPFCLASRRCCGRTASLRFSSRRSCTAASATKRSCRTATGQVSSSGMAQGSGRCERRMALRTATVRGRLLLGIPVFPLGLTAFALTRLSPRRVCLLSPLLFLADLFLRYLSAPLPPTVTHRLLCTGRNSLEKPEPLASALRGGRWRGL